MNFYMNKDKSIMCPNCHKFLTKADSKDPRTHKLACRHCHKWIWYVPNNDENFQIKEIPNPLVTVPTSQFMCSWVFAVCFS